MKYLTWDIFSDLICGQSFNLITNHDLRWLVNAVAFNNCHNYLKIAFPPPFNRQPRAWKNPFGIFYLSPANDEKRLTEVLNKWTNQPTNQEKADDRHDIWSILATAQDPKTGDRLTAVELRDEAILLLTAGMLNTYPSTPPLKLIHRTGSDTIATALQSILSHLSQHPSAYTRLTSEIRTTFPTLSHIRHGPLLTSCHYLRACIDESLRLSPPPPGPFWRETGPGGATIDGLHVPEGCQVAVDIWALHHNPIYFPNPFDFNPDRFMPKPAAAAVIPLEREPKLQRPKFDFFPTSRANTIFPSSPSAVSPNSFQGMYFPSLPPEQQQERRESKAFAPFLMGSRGCVGKGLAYLEMGLVVATILWGADLRVPEGVGRGKGARWMGGTSGGGTGTLLQIRRREDVEDVDVSE